MPEIAELIASLAGEGQDARLELIQLGEPTVESLLQAFTDPSNPTRLRVQAARVLSEIGDHRAIGSLLTYFDDRSNPERPSIALCFTRLHDARVLDRLLEAMDMDEEDVNVRSFAMCSLVTIGEPRTREKLLEALERVASGKEPDEIMRSEVITFTRSLLVKLGDREGFSPAIGPLRRLLHDPDPWIQKNAAKTLAAFDVTST